jgi:ABC-2 type transport system ATP-binding protein
VPELPLRVAGVTREFPTGGGVRDVDLEVRPGEIHALVGLNGAGKSTLMRLMLGMLLPASGRVLLGDVSPREAGAETWARVGHLVENPFAYGELTGRANLELGALLHAVPRDRFAVTVDAVIEELNLARYASLRARSMSLGNRQRLGLASALQHHPALLILDEPSNSLDPSGVILLRTALQRRAAEGAAILVSSHHLDEVARVADRITVLNEGRVIGALDPGGVDIERAFFALVHADDERRNAQEARR